MHWTVKVREKPDGEAAVTVGNEVYLFRFESYSSEPRKDHMDVYIFNSVSLRWRKLPPVTKKRKRGEDHLEFPGRWRLYTAVLVEDTIYIWGGCTNNTNSFKVLYAFDVNTHTWFKPRMSGSVPEGRYAHSACVLGKVMIIYGGFVKIIGGTNDIYKLDTTTMVWSLINTRGTPPPASTYHSATIIGIKMFVFGGGGENYRYHKTIRVFDTENNCWLDTSSAQRRPWGRDCHSAFAYNGELYIFGGENDNYKDIFHDLWKFNPETCSLKEVKPKGNGPLGMTLAHCCMMGDRVILFGGYKELFILDLSPSLKTLCKLAVIQYGLDQSELPHDLRWELAANKE